MLNKIDLLACYQNHIYMSGGKTGEQKGARVIYMFTGIECIYRIFLRRHVSPNEKPINIFEKIPSIPSSTTHMLY